MKKRLPIYEFIISENDDGSGISAISIVNSPAFQSKVKLMFSKEKFQFITLADKKGRKRKIAGLALIPNELVFRIDDLTGENYYGFFSAETIEKIVEKFHSELNNNKVNLDHNDNEFINAVLIEDFIVNSEERIADLKAIGIEHKNIMGSWFTKYLIKDDKALKEIEMSMDEGNPVGLSVECYLDRIMVQMTKNNYNFKMKKDKKNLLDKIVALFKSESFERALVPELGFEIEWNDVGSPVNKVEVDPNGNETLSPVGPGEFITESGVVIADDSSNLLEVRELPAQPEETIAAEQPVSGNTENPDEKLKLPVDEELKDYPWDQCISDQLAAGYSQESADKVCGYIKSKNMSKESLTDEILREILGDENCLTCKDKKKMAEDKLQDPIEPPVELPPAEPPVDVKSKTIGEVVGTNDGEYWVKVVVEGGIVTEAEVSSETDLLKTQLEEVKKENDELNKKLKEPIGEPILEPVPEKKEWSKMNAYEKALYRAKQEK